MSASPVEFHFSGAPAGWSKCEEVRFPPAGDARAQLVARGEGVILLLMPMASEPLT